MKTLALISLILLFTPYVLSSTADNSDTDQEFFPDWQNCNSQSSIQFIDFYLDHQPIITPSTQQGLTNNTDDFTICAGEGNNVTIGEFKVELLLDNSPLVGARVPSLEGQKFEDGEFKHCFQVEMPEVLVPGNYSILVKVYKGTKMVGCINADWGLSSA